MATHRDESAASGQLMSEREYLLRSRGMEQWTEWVEGRLIVMPPPTYQHADLAGFLLLLIGQFVEERNLGKVLRGSYQVRFARMRCRRSPDLIFISNTRLRRAKHWHFDGAPDAIFEITSPDSQSRDRREKFLEYEAAGVREYWIIDPMSQVVEAYVRSRRATYKRIDATQPIISSRVIKGFHLKLEWLWRDELPKIAPLLRAMKRRVSSRPQLAPPHRRP